MVLEEVQMAPGTLPGIVHRLALAIAMRAGEPSARGKTDVEINPSPIDIEGRINDLPRTFQAKRSAEQRHLIQNRYLADDDRDRESPAWWSERTPHQPRCQLRTPAAQQRQIL